MPITMSEYAAQLREKYPMAEVTLNEAAEFGTGTYVLKVHLRADKDWHDFAFLAEKTLPDTTRDYLKDFEAKISHWLSNHNS